MIDYGTCPIENIEDAIITSNGRELKAWAAIADYLRSCEDTDGDGIANVPTSYAQGQGRKIAEDSRALGDLLKNPNRYAVAVTAILILAAAVIITLVIVVIKCIRKLINKSSTHHR